MEWFKAFHIYRNLENQFQISATQKSDFFSSMQIAQPVKKTTYHTITFEPCSQNLWNFLYFKYIPCPHVLWKLQRKRVKTPFVVSCLEFLYCQKIQLGPLQVNIC